MSHVTIVDFGAGNLLSVARAFRHLGADIELAATPEAIMKADRLVLPGVGAFGACMQGLISRSLDGAVKAYAESGRPFLGICVGMQMLFEQSDEFGPHEGLGLIPGKVARIPGQGAAGGAPHKVPHIGWNELHPSAGASWRQTLLRATPPGESMYFVHSFVAKAANAAHCLADCDYNGLTLLAVARKDNVTGCQFHPEKSGLAGLRLLQCLLEE